MRKNKIRKKNKCKCWKHDKSRMCYIMQMQQNVYFWRVYNANAKWNDNLTSEKYTTQLYYMWWSGLEVAQLLRTPAFGTWSYWVKLCCCQMTWAYIRNVTRQSVIGCQVGKNGYHLGTCINVCIIFSRIGDNLVRGSIIPCLMGIILCDTSAILCDIPIV